MPVMSVDNATAHAASAEVDGADVMRVVEHRWKFSSQIHRLHQTGYHVSKAWNVLGGKSQAINTVSPLLL